MKMINRILSTALITVICLFTFAISSFATTPDTTDTRDVFPSNTIGEPRIHLESLLSDKVTKEIVDDRYRMFSVEKPEAYTFDTSTYLVEYNVSTEYWSNVSNLSYEGLTEAIDYSYPTIYIPLFGDIADSKGNTQNRVIGHIKLSYDVSADDYKLGMSLYNLADDDYKDKKNVWFYEKIEDYLSQSENVAEQVFLIRYPSSLSDGHEKIAVIQTEDRTVILDVSNSLNIHTDKAESGQAPAYTISEYRALRMEIEKELYQTAIGGDKNSVGESSYLNQDEKQDNNGEWMWCLLIVAFSVGIVTFLLLRKHSERLSKKDVQSQ